MNKMHSGLNEEDSQYGSLMNGIDSSRQFSFTDSTPTHVSEFVKAPSPTPLSLLPKAESILATYMPVPSQKPGILIARGHEKALTACIDGKTHIEQRTFSISDAKEIEDEEVLTIETISMQSVKIKQAKRKTRSFFFSVFILFIGILLLGTLTIFIAIIPDLIYKIEIAILVIVGFSYLVSTEAKCLYRARGQRYLTASQIVPGARKKTAPSSSEDMKHFLFVAQDTETFLRTLTTKNLNREVQR